MTEQKELNNVNPLEAEVAQLRAQLDAVTQERDQYKEAYIQVSEQNASMWGLYSNTVDYLITSTQRKNK